MQYGFYPHGCALHRNYRRQVSPQHPQNGIGAGNNEINNNDTAGANRGFIAFASNGIK